MSQFHYHAYRLEQHALVGLPQQLRLLGLAAADAVDDFRVKQPRRRRRARAPGSAYRAHIVTALSSPMAIYTSFDTDAFLERCDPRNRRTCARDGDSDAKLAAHPWIMMPTDGAAVGRIRHRIPAPGPSHTLGSCFPAQTGRCSHHIEIDAITGGGIT
ncbi:hypothetical protein HETIRDRAFT_107191 [Heterobasidion irregulare TC 32-1]|uniref:Uncharacterized protein n=1 Tax=Heterobasidion irregulare (strain TC 32-1) TaxID=747525 RepID=W4KB75_HETIT|nr:uncharacterized protein HETIRDRAFT_107191 [Heterobasidion irregulare TC 32-1]ETW83053.1 hypothetical protein HETIRDRAFT_107191 [Heterobasidion irregulare TC 32-1]